MSSSENFGNPLRKFKLVFLGEQSGKVFVLCNSSYPINGGRRFGGRKRSARTNDECLELQVGVRASAMAELLSEI